ncbi:uncharacterized protein METZ01_LOCUS257895, partial [marine metagenome]
VPRIPYANPTDPSLHPDAAALLP